MESTVNGDGKDSQEDSKLSYRVQRFFNKLKKNKKENFHVVDDLLGFTGLDEEQLALKIVGTRKRLKEEFDSYRVNTKEESLFFYTFSNEYLFHNADRKYWDKLNLIAFNDQPVLDYGAGIGQNSIGLYKKGLQVWYHEVNIIQREFMKYRKKKNNYRHIHILERYNLKIPYDNIGGGFRSIVLCDVLEHIPYYSDTLLYLIERLVRNGKIIENTPFKNDGEDSLHLSMYVSLDEAMKGMKKVKNLSKYANLWIKE